MDGTGARGAALLPEMLAVCRNPDCRQWTVWTDRPDGRRRIVARIPAGRRRDPSWAPARPALPSTAARAAAR
jgi:hypothetical protein